MSDFQRIAALLADWPSFPTQTPAMVSSLGQRITNTLTGLRDPEQESPGPLDLAGLLSHLLRQESLRQRDPSLSLRVPSSEGWPDAALWARCLCPVTRVGTNHLSLRASAWKPLWLTSPGVGDPLEPALLEETRRRDERIVADPALSEVMGHTHYLGPGQRMAIRSAMLMPSGSTLLVVLPTGGGKSLALFAPALLQGASDGLTLVIVPTVALAMDQARRAGEHFKAMPGARNISAWAYHGGLADAEKRALRQRIRDGTQPILFASPEAAMHSLRPALLDAARAGRLRSFVIDEAHLVAQWGGEFRPEFQAVSGLRRTLLGACGEHPRFRTLLLTATLTEEAWWTLSTLFGDGYVSVCASVTLRPEPAYYLAASSNDERLQRVEELVHVLPRPFILYTTTRIDCDAWNRRLSSLGLRRVGRMRGGLEPSERERVLQRWADRELDVMVATSAFGLGMDQADVRAVVHACVPETVDRFYQEVGRGGRDGKACLSFLVHTPGDVAVAKFLNTERIISVKKGLARWRAMLGSAKAVGDDGSLLVSLKAKPPSLTGDSDANVAWNLRTLVLMARAGLLVLEAHTLSQLTRGEEESEESFERRKQAAFKAYATKTRVKPADLEHTNNTLWDELVQAHRLSSRRAGQVANKQVGALLSGQRSFASIFGEIYLVPSAGITVSLGTSNCPESRRRGEPQRAGYSPEPAALKHPQVEIGPSLARVVGSRHQVFVSLPVLESGSRDDKRLRRKLVRLMGRLVADGLREVSAPDKWIEVKDYRRLYQRAQPPLVLHSPPEREVVSWPEALPVPRLSLVWPRATPGRLDQVLGQDRPLHFIFLPEDVPDPSRPDRRFLDTREHFTFADFERSLG